MYNIVIELTFGDLGVDVGEDGRYDRLGLELVDLLPRGPDVPQVDVLTVTGAA